MPSIGFNRNCDQVWEAVMTTSAQQRFDDNSIPKVTCPQCGSQMVLSRVEPECTDNHDRMVYDCNCGFEFRLSDKAR